MKLITAMGLSAAMVTFALASPVVAQTAPAATVATTPTPVDPARLAAARDLIDTIMPPATRAQMIDTMVRPMLANLQRGIAQDPSFAAAFNNDPRARDLFARFMQKQTDRTLAHMGVMMPGLWEAMARAYARRFDIAQMQEIKAFFATPTGRVYMQQALTIMSDPDIAAWQQQMLHDSLAHVQEDVAELSTEMADLERDKKP